jgi:hypothetical protein
MTLPRTVAEILRDHVTLEVEGIDRMYLNAVVPILQTEGGIAWFFKECRGHRFPSSTLMAPMTRAFVESLEGFVESEGLDVVTFERKQRKDEVAAEYRARFRGEEGLLFVGKAQEKASVFRTERRTNPQSGASYAWLFRSTAMVNQYYFYAMDRDFGPFFLKFCSYFPYNAKLCINGHEYAKRQLERRRIRYEALDNGVLSCEDPTALQRICDELSAEKIDALLRKWLRRLPHPFTPKDRSAGIRYALSILQAEFSLTQVLDQPLTGRVFFEEVIRENLDIGRPDQVQLIFDRTIVRKGPHATPGRFRTRVITEGVYPSLHVDYKATRIKQYHKEGRALRTETTINNTPTLGLASDYTTFPHSGRSASKPTDVYLTSRESAMTARLASRPFTPSSVRSLSATSELLPFVSQTNACKPSSMHSSSSGSCPTASRIAISESDSSPCAVTTSRLAALPTISDASACTG